MSCDTFELSLGLLIQLVFWVGTSLTYITNGGASLRGVRTVAVPRVTGQTLETNSRNRHSRVLDSSIPISHIFDFDKNLVTMSLQAKQTVEEGSPLSGTYVASPVRFMVYGRGEHTRVVVFQLIC